MKRFINTAKIWFTALAAGLLLLPATGQGQETTETPVEQKPEKNTFQSVWIIDNQTVMVPIKGTFEFDIMHRFGTMDKGYDDLVGLFAPSNIRLGFSYAPIKNLNVGFGLTKSSMLWDGNVKYAIMTQTPKKFPVSITYYANGAFDSREEADVALYEGSPIKHMSDRFYYFHQLIIARKITNSLSVQVAPSLSYQNAVAGYYFKNSNGDQEVYSSMKHEHFAIAVSARYKLTNVTSLMVNYDQPLTKHPNYNPNPNIGFGFEFNTSSHSFQVFASNYYLLNQQRNNLFNANNPFKYTDNLTNKEVKGGMFLIGFNITRLWNF